MCVLRVVLNMLIVVNSLSASESDEKPNIVIIMADDLGFNDVSFHGSSEIPTPNIDALAYNGVIMNRFYTPPLCTPSRASAMTGKYPAKLGMDHWVIISDEPWGLGLREKLMPEYYQENGYRTSLIGKWHLGFYQKQYTPTMRGFDTHFGYWGPYIDYNDYSLRMLDKNYTTGYDMRRNLTVADDINPKPYVTDLFTSEAVKVIANHDEEIPLFLVINHLAPHSGNEDDPMQAPQDEIDKFQNIPDLKRRTLAAMISILDRGVGEVVEAIRDKGMLENTIIIFYSDNGAPTTGIHSTQGSNYPLRGQKQSGWEGAIRNVALIYSPLIHFPQRVSNDFIHTSDLLPTLGSAAGISVERNGLDGINQWPTISFGLPSARFEIVNNIDPIVGFSSYTFGSYKIVDGTSSNGLYDGWLGDPGRNAVPTSSLTYATNVLQSRASKAIRSIQKKKNQLTTKKIMLLRKEATVKCFKTKKNHCDLLSGPCLFNIIKDPCEQNDIAELQPLKMKFMEHQLEEWTLKAVRSRRKPADPACNPANFNGTWNFWQPDGPIV